jgi:hypothetical protein
MRIDSSGNLLVGTTSTSVSLDGMVFAPGATGYMSLVNSSSTSTAELLYLRRNGLSGSGNFVEFQYGASLVGSISCTSTTTTYSTSSDYRLKHDIQPMTGALAKVAQLKPVTYKWNADDSQSQGFIAHELQAVCPEAVTGEKDAVETYTDEDGNEATRPVHQGIDTSFLVATLTAAIQELKAIVDTQASTITTLTDRITALEAK